MNGNAQGVAVVGFLAGIWAVATYYAGNITALFYLMIIFGIVEYIMGMAAAKWYPLSPEDKWNKDMAIKSFIRKIAHIFLVGVAWGIDFMVLEADKAFNLPMQWGPYFGVFAICYLILAEGLSTMQSAEQMGIRIPFLTTALVKLKEKLSKGPTGGD